MAHTHTNVASAMDFHTKTYNQTSKGATQYSFSGASSVDPVQNVIEKLVVLNTSLVRGSKSTTESIGVDRDMISTHVRSVMDAIELIPMSSRSEWYKKLIVVPIPLSTCWNNIAQAVLDEVVNFICFPATDC